MAQGACLPPQTSPEAPWLGQVAACLSSQRVNDRSGLPELTCQPVKQQPAASPRGPLTGFCTAATPAQESPHGQPPRGLVQTLGRSPSQQTLKPPAFSPGHLGPTAGHTAGPLPTQAQHWAPSLRLSLCSLPPAAGSRGCLQPVEGGCWLHMGSGPAPVGSHRPHRARPCLRPGLNRCFRMHAGAWRTSEPHGRNQRPPEAPRQDTVSVYS